MTRDFDDILNQCVESMLAGDSIEACLARYPEHARELEPLLRTAFATAQASHVEPRPEFRAAARQRLMTALAQRAERRRWRFSLFGWQRRWAFAVTVALVILLSGTGTVFAAENSLPGDALYEVKMASEEVRLALTRGDLDRAKLEVAFAQRRIVEMEEMVGRGKPQMVDALALRLANHIERVERLNISAQRPRDVEELRTILERDGQRQLSSLDALLERAPERAKPVLRQTIEMTENRYQRALRAVGGDAEKIKMRLKPGGGPPVQVKPKSSAPAPLQVKPSTLKKQGNTGRGGQSR